MNAIKWDKPIEHVLCKDRVSVLLKAVPTKHNPESYLIDVVDSEGDHSTLWVDAYGRGVSTNSVYVRNVPPAPVTLEGFINIPGDNDSDAYFRFNKSEAMRCSSGCKHKAVRAKLTYYPE